MTSVNAEKVLERLAEHSSRLIADLLQQVAFQEARNGSLEIQVQTLTTTLASYRGDPIPATPD